MRLILQRVSRAAVDVGEERVGEIGRGLLVLAGVEHGDGPREVSQAAAKIRHLRVFEDSDGRMNLDVGQVGGGVLLVSQFTLLASTDRGRRPSFERAARPERAEPLLADLARALVDSGLEVATGRFGADMQVSLVNDGPVTLALDIVPEPGSRPD